ncbi:hypothetical protein CRE_18758 [Caenorhabditis remanei]|uniref:Uncharacterized protein n=1 Tax=Caenorhabditis remanei TaxID=31234 RepID=E3LJZ4_CAERE|nr:hypothetical protein CRE_18758 [Caenorhabditis remanei]
MDQYRNGYYAQNCHPDTFTWFDSWEYPAYFSHSISLIMIPLNIFGGYCILFQTPKKMEGSKLIMFNLHFWTSFLDLLISSLLTPYIFFPAMCGITVGIFSWLQVPIIVQVFLAQCGLVAIPVFIVILPILYCGCAIEWYYYNQAFSNTAVICITFHGMSSTIAILSIYEPYRNYTKSCFSRILRETSSNQTTPKNISVTPKPSNNTNRRPTLFNVQV